MLMLLMVMLLLLLMLVNLLTETTDGYDATDEYCYSIAAMIAVNQPAFSN